MLKLLYNATSSFERNFTEISQLQAQRRNEIRVINDCISKLINRGGPNKLWGGGSEKKRKINKCPPSIKDLRVTALRKMCLTNQRQHAQEEYLTDHNYHGDCND